jgi:ADP-ribosylglycohydrolase
MGRRDCLLTGADPVSAAAAGALVVAVAHAIAHGDGPHGDGPAGAHRAALDWSRRAGVPQAVTDALTQAASGPPGIVGRSTATAATVLHNAFSALLHAEDVASGVLAALQRGGESGVDAGVDAAITGALLGAVHGRQAVPAQWRSMVLSCRPHPLRTAKPRPRIYWPTDVFELAERLLLAGVKPSA